MMSGLGFVQVSLLVALAIGSVVSSGPDPDIFVGTDVGRRDATAVLIHTEMGIDKGFELLGWSLMIRHAFPDQDLVILCETAEYQKWAAKWVARGSRLISLEKEFQASQHCACNSAESCTAQKARIGHLDGKTDEGERCYETDVSLRFSAGYRTMCRLWYSDLWPYLERYDFVLRIDFDVAVMPGRAPWPAHVTHFATAERWGGEDDPGVTVGMKDFFQKDLGSTAPRPFKDLPYTNIMMVNVTWARTDPALQRVFKAVRDTNCVCNNR